MTLYKWEVKGPSGRWKRLTWRMTSEQAASWAKREGVEIRAVPGSDETPRDFRGDGNLMDHVGLPKK